MGMIGIVLVSAVILTTAYLTYGRLLVRLLQLDGKRPTPAVELRDDVDFEPIAASTLFPQHFSAIAAAGPIVGPILAGLAFGWLPALIWILIGSIFIGGVHDFASLVASIRHKARSIAEVVRDHMSGLSYVLFLTFIWIALVYIIVAFTDITASSFVGPATEENGNVGGGAIASSSLLYLILPIVMGLLLRFGKLPLGPLTVVFILLVGVAIGIGKFIPFDVEQLLPAGTEHSGVVAKKVWDVALLVYCLVAGMVPVWLLLQPRGHLGGYFLYFALGAGALGLVFGGMSGAVGIEYPAIRVYSAEEIAKGNVPQLFPLLFIMVACGACSGFHSLIASGTTSKQLRTEMDARPVGYGAMLLEAMVAIVSLCCVMMFAQGAPELTGKSPNQIYASGIGKFVEITCAWVPSMVPGVTVEGIRSFGVAFALMAFTTFVYDTLDVCTRLGRYIIQELTGLQNLAGKIIGTALTAGVPLFFLLRHPNDAAVPVWRIFWNLFGASNQLLAALTLIGITVWLWKTRREVWVWVVVGLPAVWMYAMSTWALTTISLKGLWTKEGQLVSFLVDPVPYIGIVLLGLAAIMLVEAIRVILASFGTPSSSAPAMNKNLAGAGAS